MDALPFLLLEALSLSDPSAKAPFLPHFSMLQPNPPKTTSWARAGHDSAGSNSSRVPAGIGFERMVERVDGIENKLGIYDLAQFTPPGGA
jgi:hypothetical protein